MGVRSARSISMMAGLWVLACGGHVAGQGSEGTEAGAGNPPAQEGGSFFLPPASTGDVPQDAGVAPPSLPPPPPPPSLAPVPSFLDDAGEQCVFTYNPGAWSSASCTVELTETCGSTTYYATCRCPQGTCGCFGPTSGVASFTGCPACPGETTSDAGGPSSNGISPRDAFALCGFPH
jgi:hypothetical protein